MSTLKVDAVTASQPNTNLTLDGTGTGIVVIASGATVGGSLISSGAGGATAAEATNIIINSFNIAAAGGFAYQNMVDGVVDGFEDATGIDAGTSTNEYHNHIDSFYSTVHVATSSASGEWSGNTGEMTFSGLDVTNIGGAGDAHIKVDDTLTGDFSVQFTVEKLTSSQFGFYPTSADGSFNDSSGAHNAGLGELAGMFSFTQITGLAEYAGESEETIGWAEGDVMKWERVGSVVKLYKNGSVARTMTGTSSGTVRVFCGTQAASGMNIDAISWTDSATVYNTILFSNATTALAVPDDANIVIRQEDIESITLNTDLKAYASRNGGTTYTQITLAEVSSLTTGRILTGTVDISGQSSAVAMKYKIETLNTKKQTIHAVALQWS